MERTVVILKPDAVQRGLVGEVITRLERAGLKIVAMKMVSPSEEHYDKHYEEISKLKTRIGEDPYYQNMEFMMSGPVIAMVIEGLSSVSLVRKMVGATEPASAQPGTIRGDYSHMAVTHANEARTGVPNLVHASGDPEEAKQEVELWFGDDEIFEYKATHEHLTQPKKKQ